MKIQPLFDRVILKPEQTNKSVSGLVLPDTHESKPQIGVVVAVGDGVTFDGEKTEMLVKIGDKVMYQKYAGDEIKLDDETHVVIRQIDIIGVING
ncbi:MAG: co-chaperone GroES [Clostridiales bacterium]|nr:co-chaperone GroES [Clostridiales bacterium]